MPFLMQPSYLLWAWDLHYNVVASHKQDNLVSSIHPMACYWTVTRAA